MPTPMLLPVTGGNNPWFVIGVIMAVVLFALSALLWRVAKKAI
jgi:LPXTG-motif cell wall-anchored protein